MSRFSGPQYEGAGRAMRAVKRTEADARDAMSARLARGRKVRHNELDPAIYTGTGLRAVSR